MDREFPPERGEAHRPVDEEQHAARVAAPLDVAEHEPGRQAEAGKRLQSFDDKTAAQQVQARPRPLDGQRLVSPSKRTLGAMCPDADQAEQAVQIEPAHGRSVSSLSELSLGEHALGRERNTERESRRERGSRSAGGIDPGQRRPR